jgi:hypothetical protein
MESKKCIECGTEFEFRITPGVEQKYCSKKCRIRAGNNRRFDKIKNELINETKAPSISEPERTSESLDRVQRDNTRAPYGFGNIADNHLATIEKLYEAKTETNFYKLKVEQLEKENNQLKIDLMECENDDSEEKEENNNGWLSGVEKTFPTLVKSYREDPEATMGFIGSSANMIFNSIFKSKSNASTIASR